jgi:hypothetical protein
VANILNAVAPLQVARSGQLPDLGSIPLDPTALRELPLDLRRAPALPLGTALCAAKVEHVVVALRALMVE